MWYNHHIMVRLKLKGTVCSLGKVNLHPGIAEPCGCICKCTDRSWCYRFLTTIFHNYPLLTISNLQYKESQWSEMFTECFREQLTQVWYKSRMLHCHFLPCCQSVFRLSIIDLTRIWFKSSRLRWMFSLRFIIFATL